MKDYFEEKFKSKYLKGIWIGLFIFFGIFFIGFIVATFYDREMMDFLTPIMRHTGVKVFVGFSTSMGQYLPIIAFILLASILLETYIINLKRNKDILGKKRSWVLNNEKLFVGIIYSVFLMGFLTYAATHIYNSFNYDYGYGIGNDVYLLSNKKIRPIAMVVSAVLLLILFAICVTILRTNKKIQDKLFNSRIWEKTISIIIFGVYSYLMIYLFKHFFGRPFYFTYIFENARNDKSIIEIINELGWTEDKSSTWGWAQAEYFPWYKPNNVLANFKYWFTTPETSDPNNDQWWNMDFPSGHTIAAMIFASQFSIFFVENKKDTNKVKVLKIITIIFGFLMVVSMGTAMIIYRFHWPTDIFFSIISGILFWIGAEFTTKKYFALWINRFKSKYTKNNNKATLLFDQSTNKIIFKVNVYDTYFVVINKKLNKKTNFDSYCDKLKNKYKIKEMEINIDN